MSKTKEREKVKESKAITLISLIITIVILLILARCNNSKSNTEVDYLERHKKQ